jgi:hypothetical protein
VTAPKIGQVPDRGGVTSHVGTEFGQVLVDLVVAVPGARGAILSDSLGYAVDYAIDPMQIAGLDLQIAGAQLGLPLSLTHDSILRHLGLGSADVLGSPSVLVEAERGALLGALVEPHDRSVLVLMLAPHASLGRALVRFDRARHAIASLLR